MQLQQCLEEENLRTKERCRKETENMKVIRIDWWEWVRRALQSLFEIFRVWLSYRVNLLNSRHIPAGFTLKWYTCSCLFDDVYWHWNFSDPARIREVQNARRPDIDTENRNLTLKKCETLLSESPWRAFKTHYQETLESPTGGCLPNFFFPYRWSPASKRGDLWFICSSMIKKVLEWKIVEKEIWEACDWGFKPPKPVISHRFVEPRYFQSRLPKSAFPRTVHWDQYLQRWQTVCLDRIADLSQNTTSHEKPFPFSGLLSVSFCLLLLFLFLVIARMVFVTFKSFSQTKRLWSYVFLGVSGLWRMAKNTKVSADFSWKLWFDGPSVAWQILSHFGRLHSNQPFPFSRNMMQSFVWLTLMNVSDIGSARGQGGGWTPEGFRKFAGSFFFRSHRLFCPQVFT